MSDATAGERGLPGWSPGALDRAFVAAYAVALTGSLAVSFLTYVYVGPGARGVREANPVTATIIDSLGLAWMVWLRTAIVVGCYWAYAALRATTGWSVLAVAFAWAGALVQVLNLALDLQVVALVGPPTVPALSAASVVLVPAVLAGVALRPPVDPLS